MTAVSLKWTSAMQRLPTFASARFLAPKLHDLGRRSAAVRGGASGAEPAIGIPRKQTHIQTVFSVTGESLPRGAISNMRRTRTRNGESPAIRGNRDLTTQVPHGHC